MYQPQFWVLRQNPCANTNQEQMRNFIITQQFITCPFGVLSVIFPATELSIVQIVIKTCCNEVGFWFKA